MNEQQTKRVAVGTWARITGFVPGEEEVFEFVPELEANVLENKIPPSSPLASALEGAAAGDRIAFDPPSGPVELSVLEVGRA
jgi:transcription elongation GreA/GreB family factor